MKFFSKKSIVVIIVAAILVCGMATWRKAYLTAAMMAVGDGDFRCAAKRLMDIDARDNDGRTALMWSVVSSVDKAKLLLDAGADINARDNDGWTALMIAVGLNSVAGAKLLIDAGADINARDNNGMTVLMWSVVSSVDCVKLLVNSGADINARDNNGMTALAYAENAEKSIDSAKVVELLLEKGCIR